MACCGRPVPKDTNNSDCGDCRSLGDIKKLEQEKRKLSYDIKKTI